MVSSLFGLDDLRHSICSHRIALVERRISTATRLLQSVIDHSRPTSLPGMNIMQPDDTDILDIVLYNMIYATSSLSLLFPGFSGISFCLMPNEQNTVKMATTPAAIQTAFKLIP